MRNLSFVTQGSQKLSPDISPWHFYLHPIEFKFNTSFFIDYLFLEGGKRREKKRERNINVWEVHRLVVSRMPPTGDLAHTPGMCPDWELNWQPFGSQAGTQSTDLHQAGLIEFIYMATSSYRGNWETNFFWGVASFPAKHFITNRRGGDRHWRKVAISVT